MIGLAAPAWTVGLQVRRAIIRLESHCSDTDPYRTLLLLVRITDGARKEKRREKENGLQEY